MNNKALDRLIDEVRAYLKENLNITHIPYNDCILIGGTIRATLECLKNNNTILSLLKEIKKELKPCPFCGFDDIVVDGDNKPCKFYASCNHCDCKINNCNSREGAILFWNRRAE